MICIMKDSDIPIAKPANMKEYEFKTLLTDCSWALTLRKIPKITKMPNIPIL